MISKPDTTLLQKIRIWQQNINRLQMGQQELLNTVSSKTIDIVAIQEPWKNSINSYSTASSAWRSVYPSTHLTNPEDTWAFMLISASLSTNNWSTLNFDSPDITAIQITTSDRTIWVFNIYVDCLHDRALDALHLGIRTVQRTLQGKKADMIWLGDFNRYHLLWDNLRNHHLFTRQTSMRQNN